MALLAEEIVEEWLNRMGYFTIRGVKLGVHEIDLLAVGREGGELKLRHIEVQASVRPIGYVCPLPKSLQKSLGRRPHSVNRLNDHELRACVDAWVEKKFRLDRKHQLRQRLFAGQWQFELVVHNVKHENELEEIEARGIRVLRLREIVDDMSRGDAPVDGASGSDLIELMRLRDGVARHRLPRS